MKKITGGLVALFWASNVFSASSRNPNYYGSGTTPPGNVSVEDIVDDAIAVATTAYAATFAERNAVNVKDSPYNAAGNNATDDYAALQAAINTGKKVMIPDGAFKIYTGLSASTEGQIIECLGLKSSVIVAGADMKMLSISARFVHVVNCGFDGNLLASTGIYSSAPKTFVEYCATTATTKAGIHLDSFSAHIGPGNNIFGNTGDGLVLNKGGSNNQTLIFKNIISGNSKNGLKILAGNPSYSDGIYSEDNDFENNTSAGNDVTRYSDILIGDGTRSFKSTRDYFESDNSQTGYQRQEFVHVGQGCESTSIRDAYMLSASNVKRDYYIQAGTSSYPVLIDIGSLKGYGIAAINDLTGVSGRLITFGNVIDNGQPDPMFKVSGTISQPRQPSFLATSPTGTPNSTGDGTTITVRYLSEVSDQSSAYSASTFTAVSTGVYSCSASALLQELDATHTGVATLTLVTSNRNYVLDYRVNSSSPIVGGSFLKMSGAAPTVDMDAGDTAYVTIRVNGGTKTVETFNDPEYNYFGCTLLN